MKILVAEDSAEKAARLREFFQTVVGLEDDSTTFVQTISDARTQLSQSKYDLLILDVVLPYRAGDAPGHARTIDLLEELSSRATLKKPNYIVGLTAYDEAIKEAGRAFVSRTWTVIKFAFEADEWREQLRACIDYISGCSNQPDDTTYKTDLCIITALQSPELDAVIKLPWNWRAPQPLDDVTFVRRGHFESDGVQHSVVASSALKMGMVPAALLAAKMIERERPRFLVIAGICGGVKGKANLGDVVFGDPVWDWQSGKHLDGLDGHLFAIAPDQLPLSSFVRARADQLRTDVSLMSAIRGAWPSPPDTELKLRIGPMASGSSVLANEDAVQKVIVQNRNLVSIEMESYGVLCASIYAQHPRPTAMAIKSVCDFADNSKNDEWQAYAAHTSAQTIKAFFERNLHSMKALAGTR